MKHLLFLIILLFTTSKINAQPPEDNFQATPQSTLETIFNAAKEKDFSRLSALCAPDDSNDGDTEAYICNLTNDSEKKVKKEFISYFKTAYINGEIIYAVNERGYKTAAVPFWFNHPSGGNRCNEVMELVFINQKWYLVSF